MQLTAPCQGALGCRDERGTLLTASKIANLALALAALVPGASLGADWSLSGESRARAEVLVNQFRAGGRGDDQQLALRTLVHATVKRDAFTAGVEVQDSRGYFDDAASPLTTSNINAADVLQLYARRSFATEDGDRATLSFGRQTLDIGSRRQIERVEFANVIFSYTGLSLRVDEADGHEWHAFYVVPVGRLPNDPSGIRDNRVEADREEWQRRIWALHAIRRDVWPAVVADLTVEAYAYGLDERDTARVPTPDRDYVTIGGRLFRAPAAGRWDFEVEPAWRTGSRRLTSSAADRRDLDVDAWTVHAHVGYTFDAPWRPRLVIDHDQASGDRRPDDDRFDQYERLFGGRRTDLGHTGVYGPFLPANIRATGARIELAPGDGVDFRFAWKHARLDSPTDAWIVARVRDPAGRSGRDIGHAYDARMRWWVVRDRLRAEFGLAYLDLGRFGREAPNVSRQGDPRYHYLQATWTF